MNIARQGLSAKMDGSIDTVVVGEGITGIGECAFENNSFTQVTLPSSL